MRKDNGKQVAKKNGNNKHTKRAESRPRGLSTRLAAAGVHTSGEFAELMSALMGDVAVGNVTPQTATAMCNAGGKLLKVVEMQHRYGVQPDGEKHKVLRLA